MRAVILAGGKGTHLLPYTTLIPKPLVSFGGYWLDIGRPDDYQYANDNFEELARRLGISV